MPARNKWHSALQPGCSCSKKEYSKKVETEWTTTSGWWWSLKKARNLQHVLIFRMDSLLSNVKIPVLRLFFYFVMKRYFLIITWYCKIFCKNTCFMVIFPFAMGSNLFVIIYNPKLHSTFFFIVGPFMPKGWISTPLKFMGSQ